MVRFAYGGRWCHADTELLTFSPITGNGYPMACVVTSSNIAALLGSRIKEVIIPLTVTDRYLLSLITLTHFY